MLNKFGSGYTWNDIDEIPYLDYVYICKCMEYESRAIELSSKGGQKVVG